MAWGLLVLAGIEEVTATIAMKYMNDTRKKWPIFVMIIGFVLSFYCLSKAMKVIPAGVAYGVWAGIGSVGVALAGILWFKERLNVFQSISLGMIILGVVGLRITSL